MNTVEKTSKVIIFNNKNSEDYWLEESFREEYYRSEIDTNHYLRSEELENSSNYNETIDEFIQNYMKRNEEAPRDLALFIKELRTFLKLRKKQ